MAHFSDRRYRLNASEVGPVMELVRVKLLELVKTRENLEMAEILFRILFRHEEYTPGRPNYPEPLTWEYLETWIKDIGPFTEKGDNGPLLPLERSQEGAGIEA